MDNNFLLVEDNRINYLEFFMERLMSNVIDNFYGYDIYDDFDLFGYFFFYYNFLIIFSFYIIFV